MSKFFRKIREKLLSESVISKYLIYAVGEIILVVFGILIALQINDYHQKSLNKKQEIYILKRFTQDLSNDISQLKVNIKRTNIQLASLDSIVDILDKNGNISKFFSLQRSIHNIHTFESNQGTYDENISSGKLQLITNDIIREYIFNYYREVTKYNSDDAMSKIRDEIFLPYINNNIYNRRESINFIFQTKAQLPKLNLKKLANDEKYYGILISAKGRHIQVSTWKNYLENAIKLKKSIELELKR